MNASDLFTHTSDNCLLPNQTSGKKPRRWEDEGSRVAAQLGIPEHSHHSHRHHLSKVGQYHTHQDKRTKGHQVIIEAYHPLGLKRELKQNWIQLMRNVINIVFPIP